MTPLVPICDLGTLQLMKKILMQVNEVAYFCEDTNDYDFLHFSDTYLKVEYKLFSKL